MTEKNKAAISDEELEKLWDDFDITCDEDEDGSLLIAEPFLHFPIGTDREDVWHWFDENHSRGVGWLMNEREK